MVQTVAIAGKMKSQQETTSLSQIAAVTAKPTLSNNNNNNNLFIYSAPFNMLGDQKRITTINNLNTINTNIRNIQIYLISKRY